MKRWASEPIRTVRLSTVERSRDRMIFESDTYLRSLWSFDISVWLSLYYTGFYSHQRAIFTKSDLMIDSPKDPGPDHTTVDFGLEKNRVTNGM